MFTLTGFTIVVITGLLFCFKNVRAEDYHQCAMTMAQDFRTCFSTFGFGSGPGNAFTPRVNAFISYCSAPGRTNGEHCVNEFADSCPRLLLASDSPTFRKRQRLASRTLDYVCSNIDVIETNIDCVERKTGDVRRCVQESISSYTMQLASANVTIGLDFLQDTMMYTGRSIVRCYVDALQEPCGSAVTNLLSNFIYGFIVHPYEDR